MQNNVSPYALSYRKSNIVIYEKIEYYKCILFLNMGHTYSSKYYLTVTEYIAKLNLMAMYNLSFVELV